MRRIYGADILFIACSILFAAHQYLQTIMSVNISFIDSYLDPFLLMPVLLHLATLEKRLILSEPGYELPAAHILGYFILVTTIGEIVFPAISSRHTADIWDVPSYALGGLLYMAVKRTTN